MEKIELILSTLVRNHRLALWILLLLLAATILLFPFHLHYEYHVIASTHVFGTMLPLFGAVFCIWFAVLLLLLFSGGKSNQWQKVVLVCLFALVFLGVLVINTPNGGGCDEFMELGHINYIQDTGGITFDNPNVGYFEAPAFHLLNSAFSQVCGLDVFETRILYLLFSGMLLAALLYLLFVKLLKNPNLASLATLLMMIGGTITKRIVFWPGSISLLLLVVLLMLLARREDRALGIAAPMALAMIILFATFAMSYTPTPIYFAFMLAGIYLLQRVAKKGIVNFSTIALFVVIFLSWQMHVIPGRFSWLAGLSIDFWGGLMNPAERFLWVFRSGERYLGEAVPLWASLTRYVRLALIFGLGGILGIWNLVKARKLDSKGALATGGLVGTTILAIISIFAFSWQGQWGRFLDLAPLFIIPIMLNFLSGSRIGGWFRRHILVLLIILVFVLSLPSFLMQHHELCSDAVYPYERSAVEFSQSAYGADELDLFSTSGTVIIYCSYLPQADLYPSPPPSRMMLRRKDVWQGMNNLMGDFENSKKSIAIFVLSERFRLPPGDPAAIQPDDPRWVEYVTRLEKNDKIYNNGHIEIYQR